MQGKNFICCFVVLIGCLSVNAQWVKQDLGTSSSLVKIYFKNDSVGFIGGADYTMFKTSDRGKTWNLQSLPASTAQSDMIVDINFPTEDIGYALPNLKSIDGGNTWDTITDFGSYSGGLYFIDELIGFTPGYKTIDGGMNWEWINLSGGSPRTDVLFINDSVGFITATYDSGIWKTTDGGNTWEIKDWGNNIRQITFASDSTGYAIGSIWEGLRKTTDQGETWVGLNVPYAFEGCITCPDNDTCYVGSYYRGIMKTVDGGQNWFVQDSTVKNISSIYCFDGNTCIAVGDSGKVYKTTNGGGPVSVGGMGEKNNEIKIFPNPFGASTTIEFDNKKNEKYSLRIYNTTGQRVRKIENIITGKIKIERENLKSGLYFFQLMNNRHSFGSGKMMIE